MVPFALTEGRLAGAYKERAGPDWTTSLGRLAVHPNVSTHKMRRSTR